MKAYFNLSPDTPNETVEKKFNDYLKKEYFS